MSRAARRAAARSAMRSRHFTSLAIPLLDLQNHFHLQHHLHHAAGRIAAASPLRVNNQPISEMPSRATKLELLAGVVVAMREYVPVVVDVHFRAVAPRVFEVLLIGDPKCC